MVDISVPALPLCSILFFQSTYQHSVSNYYMNHSPIIFLDIDGVLNTARGKNYWRNIKRTKTYQFNADFCPDAIRNLNTITQETGSKIVISSYWRSFFPLKMLKVIFKEYEIDAEVIDTLRLVDQVTGLSNTSRGGLIQYWMKEHYEPDAYVIIDDNDSGISPLFADRFVLVEEREGIADPGKVQDVLEILCSS